VVFSSSSSVFKVIILAFNIAAYLCPASAQVSRFLESYLILEKYISRISSERSFYDRWKRCKKDFHPEGVYSSTTCCAVCWR
jgi:hypothetical protein